MENQMMQQSQRNIETVEQEIREIRRQAENMALIYVVEIGRRLKEAKALLQHGEWGEWLKNKVNFSQSTADNYMLLFDEYGAEQLSLFGGALNSQALGNIGYTKALKLLAVPAEEREQFAEENRVEELSTRELDALIKERDAMAAREQETAAALAEKQTALDAALAFSEAAGKKVEELTEKLKKEKEKVKALKENPEIPPEALEKIRSEAQASAAADAESKAEAMLGTVKAALSDAEKEKEKAQAAAEDAARELAAVKAQLKMANPGVAQFKALFASVQEDIQQLRALIGRVRATDGETADKLEAAMAAFGKKYFGGAA